MNYKELKRYFKETGFDWLAVKFQAQLASWSDEEMACIHAGAGSVEFQIILERETMGCLVPMCYQGFIGDNKMLREQTFKPDVPVNDAIKLLTALQEFPIRKRVNINRLLTRENVLDELKNLSVHHPLNLSTMNKQVVEQLEKTLKNLGFGDKLNEKLEKNIKDALPEFTLNTQHEFNQKKIDYTLHFRAGEERVFFNKFDATILNTDPAKEIKQTFKINKGNGFTAKEAFNLMEGRAVEKLVFKEDERYHAWYQLDSKVKENGDKDIKQFHENYGYDVAKVLQGHGIKELNDTKSTEELLYSLKKGNIQQIHVDQSGEEKKYFVSANPQFKTVNLFDHQMKRIHREELIGPQEKTAKSEKQGKDQKESQAEKKPQKRSKKIAA